MDEQNLDFDLDFTEEEFESSPPEAFYRALRNALTQLNRLPIEAPSQLI